MSTIKGKGVKARATLASVEAERDEIKEQRDILVSAILDDEDLQHAKDLARVIRGLVIS